MSVDHELYIRRCIELAQHGKGLVSPNPMVGSVIVHDDCIIGEGWHQNYGGPHAEVNAIASVDDLSKLKESTIYVSLEPCFHFGQTPPCVDLILKHKIPRVVIASKDPNQKVAGKSIAKLQTAGVEVVSGILDKEAISINSGFFKVHLQKRPFITLKWAQSKDGYFSGINEQVWLSNSLTKRLSHKLRVESDAILVGRKTIKIDDPELNNRYWYDKKHPIRIIIDPNLNLDPKHKIFNDGLPTIVLNIKEEKSQSSIQFIQLAKDDFTIESILSVLNGKNITNLLVEGGAFTLKQFIDSNYWDEALVYSTPKTLGKGILAPIVNEKHLVEESDLGNNSILQYKNPIN